MEPKELEKIIKIAKKHGAKSLEVNGVKLEFADLHQSLGNPAESQTTLPATGNAAGIPISQSDSEPMPPDDELLYLSSPYFDQLKEQRKAALGPEKPA